MAGVKTGWRASRSGAAGVASSVGVERGTAEGDSNSVGTYQGTWAAAVGRRSLASLLSASRAKGRFDVPSKVSDSVVAPKLHPNSFCMSSALRASVR